MPIADQGIERTIAPAHHDEARFRITHERPASEPGETLDQEKVDRGRAFYRKGRSRDLGARRSKVAKDMIDQDNEGGMRPPRGDGPRGPRRFDDDRSSALRGYESGFREERLRPERGPRQMGTVKFFRDDKGFGFITPDEGAADIFVHISAVERSGLTDLDSGQRISFETEPDRRGRGPKAVALKIED